MMSPARSRISAAKMMRSLPSRCSNPALSSCSGSSTNWNATISGTRRGSAPSPWAQDKTTAAAPSAQIALPITVSIEVSTKYAAEHTSTAMASTRRPGFARAKSDPRCRSGKARQVHGRLAVACVQLVRGLVRRERVRIRPEMAVFDVAIQENPPDARADVTQQRKTSSWVKRRGGTPIAQDNMRVASNNTPNPPTFSPLDDGYGTRGSTRKLVGRRGTIDTCGPL